tara:strand:+ start:31535 stop:31840 length:306 start_codon:yes stop_codon:yes gene_type:complete
MTKLQSGLLTEQAFALSAFACKLTGAADSFRALTRFFLGWLLEMITTFHFAEKAFTLHFFLQRFKGLVDIIVAHNNLYDGTLSIHSVSDNGLSPRHKIAPF